MTNPLGIIAVLAVCVCVCVRVSGVGGFGQGTGEGESETREDPMRTRETPWQPETGSTLNGAPPFMQHQAGTQSQNDRDWERQGREREGEKGGRERGERREGGANIWMSVTPPPFKLASADINTVLQVSLNVSQHWVVAMTDRRDCRRRRKRGCRMDVLSSALSPIKNW